MQKNFKPKVLACVYGCMLESPTGWNGGEYILGWQIIKQLSRFCDVYALTHDHNREGIKWSMRKDPLCNVQFYYVGLPKCLNFMEKYQVGIQLYVYLWQIKSYFYAKKLHKKINFDVFHHITYANDWMASFIGALLPIPYIRGPGGGAHRVPKNFLKELSFKERLLDKLRSVGQWLYRRDPFFIIGQRKAKALLVCNKESFEAVPEKWRKKTYFFPVNGVSRQELNSIGSTKSQKANKEFIICTAGRLIKIKNFSFAIKVFKAFNDKVPDSKLFIAGEGPELSNLQNLVSNLGLQKKVVLRGFLSHEKLLSKMASSDVFLFTSLRDGGGAVIVEAMAVGKPVICFDSAGPGFYIDDKCGIKVKPESPNQAMEDMTGALGRLYRDKELRGRMGRAAKEKAEKKYSWDNLGKYLLEIYEKSII